MSFLLDTNVISEPTTKQPNRAVIEWLSAQPAELLFLSVITIGELRRGILLLDAGRKKRGLLRWLEDDIKPAFFGRILSVDIAVMERWAELQSEAKRRGHALKAMDAIIAAVALSHGLTLVTRNTADFKTTGVTLFDPWRA